MVNKLDGATQREKKAIFRSVGLEPEKASREDLISRLKVGIVDFDELVKLAGGERMPGCGAIIPVSVGFRPKAKRDEPKVLDEATAARRLRLLNQINFYLRARTGEVKNGKARQNLKRTWPGFGKALLTMSPGDSKAVIEAVKSGAMTPAQFREYLAFLSKEVREKFRKATAFGGAKGLEVEFCVWHLEQGCLHCHLYFRDVDITDPQRPRLGLFGRTSKGKELSRERLTLNSLGRSGVAMFRHREAGHDPKIHLFEETGTLVRDWDVLDIALAHRKSKNLGECWDVTLSRWVDQYWAKVFSSGGPELKRCYDEGHAQWASEWASDCASVRKSIEAQVEELYHEVFAKKDAEREALLEKNVQLEKEKKVERRNTGLATKVQITEWVDALRTVMRGGEPPPRFGNFFEKHCSGRWRLVGGTGSAERVVESCDPRDPGVVAGKEFLSLAQTYKAALDRYVDLSFDQNEAAAEAFLAREEKKWLSSVPPPTPHPLEAVVAQKDAQLREKEAQIQALQDRLAEAAPAWQSWPSTRLHEALERIAAGQENGRDELLLDHHGRIAPEVRDRLALLLTSLVPRERADARSALDVVQMHDARVRKCLFKDAGVDPSQPDPDDGERWKRSGG